MKLTPFHTLVKSMAAVGRIKLKSSLFTVYQQPKPTLRFANDECYFDDVQTISDSDDDEVPLSSIDPDHFYLFIEQLRHVKVSPYIVLKDFGLVLPHVFSDDELWYFFLELSVELRKCRYYRVRIPYVSTFEHVLRCFKFCRNIVFLVGAGISVASGIPDFRSANGIYANLDRYKLKNPTDMFSMDFFRQNKLPFFKFVPEIMPQECYHPTFTHLFMHECLNRQKLRRVYTYNIDCLEYRAGIPARMMIACHGSFATATCMICRRRCAYDKICDRMAKRQIPLCSVCSPNRDRIYITEATTPQDVPDCVLKPDIVFFGEKLKDMLGDYIQLDSQKIDLLVIVGSSLKVKPIAGLVGAVPREIPQILINKERITGTHEFDVEMIGECDAVFARIAKALGWFDTMMAARAESERDYYELYTIKDAKYQDVVFYKFVGHEWIYKVVTRK